MYPRPTGVHIVFEGAKSGRGGLLSQSRSAHRLAEPTSLDQRIKRIDGNIIVVVSEREFISFTARRPALNKAVVAMPSKITNQRR